MLKSLRAPVGTGALVGLAVLVLLWPVAAAPRCSSPAADVGACAALARSVAGLTVWDGAVGIAAAMLLGAAASVATVLLVLAVRRSRRRHGVGGVAQ